MKKILLGLGTVAAIVTPIASVVACGDASAINVYLPADSAKGTHIVNVTAVITNGKNGLIDLIKTISQSEKDQLPKEFIDITNDIKIAQAKAYSITSEAEGVKLTQDIMQKTLNSLWSKALLTETLNLKFTDTSSTPVTTTGQSVIKNDATDAFKGSAESFKNINKNNYLQKTKVIKENEISALVDQFSKLLTQLKLNPAIIAWSNSLPSGDLDSRVVLKIGLQSIELGSTKEQIRTVLKFIQI